MPAHYQTAANTLKFLLELGAAGSMECCQCLVWASNRAQPSRSAMATGYPGPMCKPAHSAGAPPSSQILKVCH